MSAPTQETDPAPANARSVPSSVDAVVIGAGFAGSPAGEPELDSRPASSAIESAAYSASALRLLDHG